ncbi:MAG: hypothetical protein KatS3mg105_4213 [Gemmatales bacterium]|nr:MAG: hypothetical protein KatS3mg105_4213 [Gemmatales bacterium]
MRKQRAISILLAAVVTALAGPLHAGPNEILRMGKLRAASPEQAKTQCLQWIKAQGVDDPALWAKLSAIWETDRPVLERVVQSFLLVNADAAKLLAEAESGPAPTEIPPLLRDQKQSPFFRANLGLAYAKRLSQRRIYEESLAVLKTIEPGRVVDPAAYYFHRAVAEFSLMDKESARTSIIAINEDVADAPDRYRRVSLVMLFEMENWSDNDLGWVARKMSNIERRLDLSRGGPQTRRMQKEIVAKLDELIRSLERKRIEPHVRQPQPSPEPDPTEEPLPIPACPRCKSPGPKSPGPMDESNIAKNGGNGEVDEKRLHELAQIWGKLPPHQRASIITGLTEGMPTQYRQIVENYFRDLARRQTSR